MLALLVAATLSACRPAQSPAPVESVRVGLEGELVHAEDFESGSWDDGFWHPNWCEFSYCCQVVPSPEGAGLVFRAEYRAADCDGSRPTMGDELSSSAIEHDEQWLGMRIYFSSAEFGFDNHPMILVQHHGRPDFDLGEEWRNPVTALTYEEGGLTLRFRGSSDPVTPRVDGSFEYTDSGIMDLGPPALDAWNHFVIHTVWDATGFTGLIEVWHDGEHQALRDVNISFNDASRPYLKFGQYNWRCESDDPVRVSYYDDVTIVGGPLGVFCDVVPPGSPMPPGVTCDGEPPVDGDPNPSGPFTPLDLEGCDVLAPVVVRASSFDETNYPSNTLDGDLSTRWSAQGDGEWIEYDLGLPRDIAAVAIAFYRGDERTAEVDLLVSDNGRDWAPAGVLASSGATTEPQTLEVDALGRYLRLVGHGTSLNLWNSLTEVVICRGDSPDDPGEDGGGPTDGGTDADADADGDGGVTDDADVPEDGGQPEDGDPDLGAGEGSSSGGCACSASPLRPGRGLGFAALALLVARLLPR